MSEMKKKGTVEVLIYCANGKEGCPIFLYRHITQYDVVEDLNKLETSLCM